MTRSSLSHVATAWTVGAIVVALMDLWAGFLHGRIWHGTLWPIHRSHHAPRRGRFERNDALSALHAPIAMALVIGACQWRPGVARDVAFGAGVGMTVFGGLYVLLHDGLVHGRLPVRLLARLPVLRAIAEAHRTHHRTGGGPPYGFLFGPWEQALTRSRGGGSAPPRSPNGPRHAAQKRAEREPTPPDGAPRSGARTQ